MTRKQSVNTDRATIEDVWTTYEDMRACIVGHAGRLRKALVEGTAPSDPQYLGMSADELDEHFERLLEEADHQASLFMIAAAEATLRVDFLERVYTRGRDSVSRAFRAIYKEKRDHSKVKVRLVEDILETWAADRECAKSTIGLFKGAIRFRHWLAHGRYWVPKLGQSYDPHGLVRIIGELFDRLGFAINNEGEHQRP